MFDVLMIHTLTQNLTPSGPSVLPLNVNKATLYWKKTPVNYARKNQGPFLHYIWYTPVPETFSHSLTKLTIS